jgi:hypothetical protein
MPSRSVFSRIVDLIGKLPPWQAAALVSSLIFLGPVVAVFVLIFRWPVVIGVTPAIMDELFEEGR